MYHCHDVSEICTNKNQQQRTFVYYVSYPSGTVRSTVKALLFAGSKISRFSLISAFVGSNFRVFSHAI